jgi:anaerobic magnesium-protoporphyrin IX monomethyl ester cyclase
MKAVIEMHVVLATLNAKYIHKNLALRWLFVSAPVDFDVRLVEGVIKDDPLNTAKRIMESRPDVIGLSVYIFNAEETKRLIGCLQELSPLCRIILGGPEVTYNPGPWLDLGVEAVVCGEGEEVFWTYLQGTSSPSIATHNSAATEVAQVKLELLETFDSPYFLEIDEADMEKRYLYMETSRGCPYDCAYCLSSAEKGMRVFSEKYLRDTFTKLGNSKVRQVKFLDRTFNINPSFALKTAKMLVTLPSSIHFHVELVGDTLSEELIAFFTGPDAVRFRVEIGVQSFNRKTLLEVGRFTRIEVLKDVILRFEANGVRQHTDLIAGLPYEDLTSFKQSFNTLFSLHPYEIQVGILKLLYGTRLRDEADTYGYTYLEKAPYTVRSSLWMSVEDMDAVEIVASAVEKTYNSQKIRETLGIWVSQYDLNAYDLLHRIGEGIANLPRPYSQRDFFACLLASVIDIVPLAEARLKFDYYRISPIYTPPFFAERELDVQERLVNKRIRNELSRMGINYKHLKIVERGDSLPGYDLWLYPALGKSHTLIRINEDLVKESEIVYETVGRDA